MHTEDSSLRDLHDTQLSRWREREKTVLDLLQVAGELRFDRGVDLLLFRNPIYDTRPSEVIRAHEHQRENGKRGVDVDLTLCVAYAIAQLDSLKPCKLDIGKLAAEWLEHAEGHPNIDSFVAAHLADMAGERGSVDAHDGLEHAGPRGRDVVLYGFGRIGRAMTRLLAEQLGSGQQLRLRAIVLRTVLGDAEAALETRAALLRMDSVYGAFAGMVEVAPDGGALVINGNYVRIVYANDPGNIDYESYGVHDALLIDTTGAWRTREGLERHLARPGIHNVLLTAPGQEVPNIVAGLNHDAYNWNQVKLAAAGSCTTNAVAPSMAVLHRGIGIERAHIQTVHAYTADQNLLDNYHPKARRGRGAGLNLVLAQTCVASAVAAVIPALEGKLTAGAVRVPVPCGSLAVLQLTTSRRTSRAEVQELMRHASQSDALCEQILYSRSNEYVSSSVVGTAAASVFDAPSTQVSIDGKGVTVYIWYDNELGYTWQVLRVAKVMAGVHRARYL